MYKSIYVYTCKYGGGARPRKTAPPRILHRGGALSRLAGSWLHASTLTLRVFPDRAAIRQPLTSSFVSGYSGWTIRWAWALLRAKVDILLPQIQHVSLRKVWRHGPVGNPNLKFMIHIFLTLHHRIDFVWPHVSTQFRASTFISRIRLYVQIMEVAAGDRASVKYSWQTLGRSICSTNLYQMLFRNGSYDPVV